MTAKPMDVVHLVEQTLGWAPAPDGKPLWKARAIEAAKLKRKIATNPGLYSWHNLELAVEWCRRHKETVPSPVSICWRVERALREANAPRAPRPIGDLVDEAMELEMSRLESPGAHEWVVRFTRATGDARLDVLDEWLKAGRKALT